MRLAELSMQWANGRLGERCKKKKKTLSNTNTEEYYRRIVSSKFFSSFLERKNKTHISLYMQKMHIHLPCSYKLNIQISVQLMVSGQMNERTEEENWRGGVEKEGWGVKGRATQKHTLAYTL